MAGDYSTVTITTRIVNNSDQLVNVHALDAGLRLTGRSISAQDDHFDDLQLAPGDSFTFDSILPVTRPDMRVLDERLDGEDQRWNVNGRVSVSVSDLSDPVWIPFRFDMDVD